MKHKLDDLLDATAADIVALVQREVEWPKVRFELDRLVLAVRADERRRACAKLADLLADD